ESQLLCITVTLALPCDAPTAVTLVNVTEITADISWTASATETGGYAWYVFADGDNPLTDPSLLDGTVGTGVTNVTISGLTAATDYDVYVFSLCAALPVCALDVLCITVTLSVPCDAPTAVTLVNVTQITADISWTASPTETGGYAWYVFADGD